VAKILKSSRGALLSLIVFLSGALLESCSTGSSGAANPPLNIAGSWSGASFPGCRSSGGVHCYKRPISFELTQNGASVTGSYSCPVGNIMCGTDNSGNVVNGKMNGPYLSDLRVVFSDATNCAYQGEFTTSEGKGAYMCFAGAGRIVEQGGWELTRTGH